MKEKLIKIFCVDRNNQNKNEFLLTEQKIFFRWQFGNFLNSLEGKIANILLVQSKKFHYKIPLTLLISLYKFPIIYKDFFAYATHIHLVKIYKKEHECWVLYTPYISFWVNLYLMANIFIEKYLLAFFHFDSHFALEKQNYENWSKNLYFLTSNTSFTSQFMFKRHSISKWSFFYFLSLIIITIFNNNQHHNVQKKMKKKRNGRISRSWTKKEQKKSLINKDKLKLHFQHRQEILQRL